MNLIISLLLNALALILTSKIVPGFNVPDFGTAVVAAIVIGVINTFIKPVLLLLTIPINILTLGLFTFVINALVLVMAAGLVSGLTIDNFWPTAVIAALVLSVISTALSMLLKDIAKK